MTSNARQFAPRPPSTSGRRGVQHPWLMAAGITQLVLTQLAALGYALLGIGLGTCSDGSGGCGSVTLRYHLAGWALALNAAVGVVTVVLARPARRPLTRAVAVAAIVVSVAVAIVGGFALWWAMVSA